MPFQLQCLSVVIFVFILFGTVCVSWPWIFLSFPMLGKFSAIMSSRMFSSPFSLCSPSEISTVQMSLYLMLSQRSLKLPSILFILFFCSVSVIYFLYSLYTDPFLCYHLIYFSSTNLSKLLFFFHFSYYNFHLCLFFIFLTLC